MNLLQIMAHSRGSYMCFSPQQVKDLLKGKPQVPMCYVGVYNYDSVLHEICDILGWQGGTISQVREEIFRLQDNQKDTCDVCVGGSEKKPKLNLMKG